MDEDEYEVIENLISEYNITLTNEVAFEEQMDDADKFWNQIRMHLHGLAIGYLWMFRTMKQHVAALDDPSISLKDIHQQTYPDNNDYRETMEIVEEQEERVRQEWHR